MSHRNLVICDSELSYATNLAEMITKKKELALQVRVFSDLKGVEDFGTTQKIDFFLVEETFSLDERKKVLAIKTFVITRGICEEKAEEEILIYKYQSADHIIDQILGACEDEEQDELFFNYRKDEAKIIGMYSPLGRVGQTSYAIEKGKEYAKNSHTLYLNMESYSGIGVLFGQEEYNLSDLLYFMKQEHPNLGLRLGSFIRKMEGLDYVAPMPVAEDLKVITEEEWISLLSEIRNHSIYEIILLDVGNSIQGMLGVLEYCDEIHTLILEDSFAKTKILQFEENLKPLGKDQILEKIVTISEGER